MHVERLPTLRNPFLAACTRQVVESWSLPIDAPQNMFVVSIPTVLDPSLAPEGKHLVHIYTAGNEPYRLWQDVKRGSPEYEVCVCVVCKLYITAQSGPVIPVILCYSYESY